MGVLLGVAIWLVSGVLTGGPESWDAGAPIWLASWLLVAVAGGFAGVARAGLTVGYGLGQMLVTA